MVPVAVATPTNPLINKLIQLTVINVVISLNIRCTRQYSSDTLEDVVVLFD